jgi:hypothetical protein
MVKAKPQQTLADYVTIAISPLLIMALVGSLVFFLLEVLYQGQYDSKLRWTLFFFVFAMVLVARISIELGSERAGLYGLAMIAVCFIALQRYIEFPEGTPLASLSWAINLGLMGLAWWSTSRLTWDCTYIDDAVDASGKGVLEAAGLDQEAPAAEGIKDDQASKEEETPQLRNQTPLLAWWDRYHRYREEQRKKPHMPGVWVVYFSLAALPLYGLGQSLIPAEDTERRRYAFWLMVCYVASGLGLLLTTSFLGLRRYLRQRKLKMPVAMTGIWLALGGGIIVVLMLLGALLPRPYGEYQFTDFTPLGSKERDASRYAVNRDGSGKGDGQASTDKAREDQEARDGSGTKPDEKGKGSKSSSSARGSSGQGNQSGSGNQGRQGRGDKGGKSSDKNSAKEDSRSDGAKDRQADKSDSANDQQADKSDSEKSPEEKDADAQKRKEDERKAEKKAQSSSGGSAKQDKPREAPKGGSSTPPTSSRLADVLAKLGWLGTVLKWIVFALLAILVLFFILRQGLQFLANFTNWARRLLDAMRAWWAGLFGGAKDAGDAEAEARSEERIKRPRPFASFGNPFRDGRSEQMSPDDLARYSFEALQAWAYEQGLDRNLDETPLEFANRLGPEVPALESEVRGLAGLYARSAYGRGRLSPSAVSVLKTFWQRLESVDQRPLSA